MDDVRAVRAIAMDVAAKCGVTWRDGVPEVKPLLTEESKGTENNVIDSVSAINEEIKKNRQEMRKLQSRLKRLSFSWVLAT